MKIAIFASIGAQNLGDELILKNEIKLLEQKYGEKTIFYVFSYELKKPFFKQDNIKYIEYFPIGIRQKSNIIRNFVNFIKFISIVIKCDLIVIGGGGIIYDHENQSNKNPLNQWIFRTNIFRFFRKKIDFFAIGLDIKNNDNFKKIKKIFYKSHNITTRDLYSFELLKSLNIESLIVYDPVLYDDGEVQIEKSLIGKINSFDFGVKYLKNIDFKDKKIGISLRSGYLSNKNEKIDSKLEQGKINEIINYIIQNNGQIILLVHSFHKNDKKSSDFLYLNKFAKKSGVYITQNLHETYYFYKQRKIDLCISMRLHSMILSHVYKIPFIGVSYSKKTDEFLNNL